ncbi:MAG: PKD domain-containing protein, partial [Candidatus Bathyarchaeota archaeon]|nr:PKD domain-containing protein [Candidatus Bathyarchaeota archaeon]
DGASGSGAIVEHTYATAGNYDVTLTVTDNDGLAHTITKSITVREAPPPSIPWQLYVAAAGAAAIIIAAVTIYFLRIRKPT